jgi:hypothetical protein
MWIGGNDMATEGTFLWEDGTAFADTPGAIQWGPGEPNDSSSQEDCVQLYKSDSEWYLNDVPCAVVHYSVCDMN